LIATHSPTTEAELATTVADAFAQSTSVYPLGGGASLDYGATTERTGIGLSLTKLNRVIDYPARDMTVTVEAGVTLAELSRLLAAERQWLPVAGAKPEQATVGGLVATGWNGSRRFGWGSLRDHVIGVSAVDGRGVLFHGGGRVVKNVAGYDFCKLLTGSLGTLGVITQLTFKLKPLPEHSALLVAPFADLDKAEKLLARLGSTATTPSAVDLIVGPEWHIDPSLPPLPAGATGRLAIGLEGGADEVAWMVDQLKSEWRELLGEAPCLVSEQDAAALWDRLRDFADSPPAPAIKANLAPSRVCEFVAACQRIFPASSLQSHAGNGIVLARLDESADEGSRATGDVVRRGLAELRRIAGTGQVSLVSAGPAGKFNSEEFWGPVGPSLAWMQRVKEQFDPRGILNPGRFVFA
jgi:glycolate oxidase FAD binding subunit